MITKSYLSVLGYDLFLVLSWNITFNKMVLITNVSMNVYCVDTLYVKELIKQFVKFDDIQENTNWIFNCYEKVYLFNK